METKTLTRVTENMPTLFDNFFTPGLMAWIVLIAVEIGQWIRRQEKIK